MVLPTLSVCLLFVSLVAPLTCLPLFLSLLLKFMLLQTLVCYFVFSCCIRHFYFSFFCQFQGTIKPVANFNPEGDAEVLRKAMKGIGMYNQ